MNNGNEVKAAQSATAGCAAAISEDVRVAARDRAVVGAWLEKFEVAIPLRPYDQLAINEGTAAERKRTAALVGGDLRQPLYDDRVIFARDGEHLERITEALAVERESCHCAKPCGLPMLRAIWRLKPLLLALPAQWVEEAA